MYTIHHPARIIDAYDETFYDFHELNDDAREYAIKDWRNDFAADAYEIDAEEIAECLEHVLGQLPATPYSTYDKGCNLFLSVLDPEEWFIHPTGKLDDDGVCWSMDFADAYNKHADAIDALAEKLGDTPYEDDAYDDVRNDLSGEINAALEDIAALYNRAIDDAYDCAYYNDDCAADYLANDYVFDADGNRFDRDVIAAA